MNSRRVNKDIIQRGKCCTVSSKGHRRPEEDVAGFPWKGKGVGTRKAATEELLEPGAWSLEPGSAEKRRYQISPWEGREFSAFRSQSAVMNSSCETAAGPRQADDKRMTGS